MQRIGFIGASGLMGHGMAKNLRAKGYPLAITVHRNRERVADLRAAGASEAATPAALAGGCEIVFICVTGSPSTTANGISPCSCASGTCGSAGGWCPSPPSINLRSGFVMRDVLRLSDTRGPSPA